MDSATVRELVEEAGRQLAAVSPTDILIIKDDPLAAMNLEAVVERLGYNVTGVALTRSEAVKLARTKRPGLILVGGQLAGGSSGGAVDELLGSFDVPVIFITADPERHLTGERPEPAFLITKPYRAGSVAVIFNQALFIQQSVRGPPAAKGAPARQR